jgi:hypothetical protein
MVDANSIQLLGEAAFGFVGTVQPAETAKPVDVPTDDRTVMVHVDQVLVVPDAFRTLAGSVVALQPAQGVDPPAPGSTWTFFANPIAFGQTIALAEVGRRPAEPAAAPGTATVQARAAAAEDISMQLRAARLRAHADDADAVVLGRVIGLERVGGSPLSEHARDLWRATLHVVHARKGDVADDSEVKVLYSNSLDVAYRDVPKPKASQNGLWLLHATSGDDAQLAPYELLHAADLQPVQDLELLRDEEA